MSPIESWLVNNALEIAALIVIGVIAWSRTGKADQVEKDLARHKQDVTPHASCPVHATSLDDIKATLEKVDKRLGVIDARLFELVRNGKRGRAESEDMTE